MMVQYRVGRMDRPPRATDWVRLDLLERAKVELGVR
jgi:NitT/TauT family transport system substrate-binding protein